MNARIWIGLLMISLTACIGEPFTLATMDLETGDTGAPESGTFDAGSVPDSVGGSRDASQDALQDASQDVSQDTTPLPESGTCWPSIPFGWSLVAISNTQTACAAPWTGASSVVHNGLQWNPAACSCSCGNPTGSCTATLQSESDTQCAATPSCSVSMDGDCRALTGSNCNTSAFHLVAGSFAGSCPPVFTSSLPSVTWSETVVVCTLPQGPASCGAGLHAEKLPADFQACVAQTGDHVCPSEYPHKQVDYGSTDDTRTCSACTCNATSVQCDQGATIYGVPGCAGAAVSMQNGDCKNPPWAVQSFRTAAARGTCSASGGQASGTVRATAPTTFCCL